jgi:hypothetical protein
MLMISRILTVSDGKDVDKGRRGTGNLEGAELEQKQNNQNERLQARKRSSLGMKSSREVLLIVDTRKVILN